MDQHPFDVYARVTAKAASNMVVEDWMPPVISGAGHLVVAEPRVEAPPPPAPAPAVPDETESIRKAAYDDGFTSGKKAGFDAGKIEGLSAGKDEAMAAAKRELKPKLGELNKLLTSLSHSLNEEDYKLEKTLMELVEHIACAVIRKELALDPGSLMKVIKETISALPPSRDNIKIYLNPRDKPFADDAISAGGENWHVMPDEEVEVGGCRVVTEHSEADMTVENRIQSVLEQLYEQQVLTPKPGEPGYEPAPEPAVGEAPSSHCEPLDVRTEIGADTQTLTD